MTPFLAALSAYNYFCSKIRSQIKEEMPGIANTDIMKEAASRWKALSAEDKTPFEQLAQEDKARSIFFLPLLQSADSLSADEFLRWMRTRQRKVVQMPSRWNRQERRRMPRKTPTKKKTEV